MKFEFREELIHVELGDHLKYSSLALFGKSIQIKKTTISL